MQYKSRDINKTIKFLCLIEFNYRIWINYKITQKSWVIQVNKYKNKVIFNLRVVEN
jgi:hypothetical protein